MSTRARDRRTAGRDGEAHAGRPRSRWETAVASSGDGGPLRPPPAGPPAAGRGPADAAGASPGAPASGSPSAGEDLDGGPAYVPGDPIRVLVADDHALYRRGLEMVLGAEDDVDIVGEASDGMEAIARASQLLPDIVLMDLRMPRRSGTEACSAIKDVAPATKIVILTNSDEEADLFEAVRAGANGYLLKDVPGEDIADGLRAVMGGQSLISPTMASALLSEFAALSRAQEARPAMDVPRLTDREVEVLKHVARGMGNREIATELFISENTVKNHVRNTLEKLQVHSRMEAVMYAVKERILDLG